MKKTLSLFLILFSCPFSSVSAQCCPTPPRPCIEECLGKSVNYGDYASCRASCFGKEKFPREKGDNAPDSNNVFY